MSPRTSETIQFSIVISSMVTGLATVIISLQALAAVPSVRAPSNAPSLIEQTVEELDARDAMIESCTYDVRRSLSDVSGDGEMIGLIEECINAKGAI